MNRLAVAFVCLALLASWSRQAGDEPAPLGILDPYHDDRDRRRYLLGRQARRRAFGNDDVKVESDQITRTIRKAIDSAQCITAFDGEVPALDVSELAESVAE